MNKRYWMIAVLTVLLMVSSAWANPFIVCDPQAGVTHYKVTGAAWVVSPIPAQADGSIKMDVVSAPVGTSNLNFSACRDDGIWGELCSVTAPFSFIRPGTPATSTGVKLVPLAY